MIVQLKFPLRNPGALPRVKHSRKLAFMMRVLGGEPCMRWMRVLLGLYACLLFSPLHAGEDWEGMLRADRYMDLSARLSELDRDFNGGELPFRDYRRLLGDLGDVPAALEPKFNAWVEASKEAPLAQMARGIFLADLGWRARGSGYTRDLTRAQRKTMHDFFTRAITDLEAAIDKLPGCEACHAKLIEITKAGPGDAASLYQRANATKPGGILIAFQYLDALDPRWGGSAEEGRRFVENFKKKYPDSPVIPALEAGLIVWQGDIPYYKREYQKAVEPYSRVLAMDPERSVTSFKLAYALSELKRYDEALKWIEHSLSLAPRYGKALNTYGWILLHLNRPEDARAALMRAVAEGEEWSLEKGVRTWRHAEFGVRSDPSITWEFCQQALRAKMKPAYRCIAEHYRSGLHVRKNATEAVKWLRRGADEGVTGDMVELGNAYWSGEGVNKDENQAIEWWRKAQAAGDQRGTDQLRARLDGWRYFREVTWQREVDDTKRSWENMKRSFKKMSE